MYSIVCIILKLICELMLVSWEVGGGRMLGKEKERSVCVCVSVCVSEKTLTSELCVNEIFSFLPFGLP